MVSVNDIAAAANPLLHEYGFRGATLFGSYANGQAHEGSDIDLYVLVPEGTRTKRVFEFAFDLGSKLGVDVDAYGSHEVNRSSAFYRGIMQNGVAL